MSVHIGLPSEVSSILRRLTLAGHSAYAVGGCVRDRLMGRVPSDYDITTSALPEQTQELFSEHRLVLSGLKHGTVGVIVGGSVYEVTTFRTDGSYGDGRRPDSVSFTSDISDDLARRDFTVNAIAYSPELGLVDPFDGYGDIKRGIIRTVGDPLRRFSEDGLRILRLARFCSTLGFEPEEASLSAAKELKHMLKKVAAERISEEYIKLVCGENVDRAFLLCRDILSSVLPGLYPTVPLKGRSDSKAVRLALCGGTKGLKVSNDLKKRVDLLFSAEPPQNDRISARRFLSVYGADMLEDIFACFRARGVSDADGLEKLCNRVLAEGDCISLSELAVKGDELPTSGAETGILLKKMLDAVIDGRIENTKEELLTKGLNL